MTRAPIDFHHVPAEHREIDARLHNWARWCNGGWGAPSSSPMFRLTPRPPAARGDIADHGPQVDSADASRIAVAVTALPEKHRKAIQWAYVKPVSPSRACREIGVSMLDLSLLLRDSRQMLIVRKA
ncbi:hypothetical protein [Melaminivora sp.]|uniref:hypothetical protein n=1 Tax=Melaminivora sp. TaxID=1933032 RepID=UPI0028B16D68|nr:hypothetical protein [Melaminivora sp.]